MIRVLVVDDSGFMRLALRRIIEADSDMQVVGEAADGHAALAAAERLKPDVVAMDVEMPGLDGVEATARLAALPDAPAVVMVSRHTADGSATALAALARGAVDCLWKDESLGAVDFASLEHPLREKLRHWARQRGRPGAAAARRPHDAAEAGPCDLVAIGASTGGPDALGALLAAAGPLAVPVVIAQHMPAELGPDLAAHLGRRIGRPVALGRDGQALAGGAVLVIPGGQDGHVLRRGAGLALRLAPGQGTVRPSVDLLLGSAAVAARRATGVVLTGMGRDGAAGAAMMAERGMPLLVQSAASCVVAGMPGAALAACPAAATGTPAELGARLARMAGRRA